mgnify:CR=1 FL=1
MKDKKKRIIFLTVVILIAVCVGVYFFVKYQSYNYVEVTTIYENTSTDNANYKRCLEGILRYSRDGVALLADNGEELWNQPCQMGNPTIAMCGGSVAVGDKGGTSILVLENKGLKGEIQTTKPIEKFAVSSQGIVSAILKDDETPLVMCYDAVGNKLVEHKDHPKNMGYPVDVSISHDGNTLLVSYLHTEGSEVVSKISYYYFGDKNTAGDHQVYQKDFRNTVIPMTTFLKNDISLLVTDNALVFYKGLRKMEETHRVELKTEIQSVAYNDELIAVILRKDNDTNYKLNIYDIKGKILSSVDVNKEYENMVISDGQVIMYDGQACSIYMKNGVCKFEGNIEQKIMEVFPLSGLNKYMVINTDGLHEIRLAK